MESNQSILKTLEIKLKFLESENQNSSSKIEENNKEINRIKSLITSITDNNSLTLCELCQLLLMIKLLI